MNGWIDGLGADWRKNRWRAVLRLHVTHEKKVVK